MPSRKRHRERVRCSNWTVMVADTGVRDRLLGKHPEAVLALDYLAGQKEPFVGRGWTVFNDWLDVAYCRHFAKRPMAVPYVPIEKIRESVFPACRL